MQIAVSCVDFIVCIIVEDHFDQLQGYCRALVTGLENYNAVNSTRANLAGASDWIITLSRVHRGHGQLGKTWNLSISFSRPGKSWNLIVGP